jgi:protein-S-isoprenylcysteine O-methyltransferase Ste14
MRVEAAGRVRQPGVPQWGARVLAALIWLVGIPIAHGVAPWAISRFGPSLGWRTGGPSAWNLLGLLPVGAGVVVLGWVMIVGFAEFAELPERIPLDWSPKVFIARGPYAFSRHPMYLAELALWLGWAGLYGSVSVLIGFVVLSAAVSFLARREERALEATFGERYRRYTARVPRWLGLRRPT